MNTRATMLLLLGALSQPGLASPTADEFQRCDAMRAAALQNCRAPKVTSSTNSPPDERTCRTRSQEMKDACYRQVDDQYRRPSADERAQRTARERMMREARQKAEPAEPAAPAAPAAPAVP